MWDFSMSQALGLMRRTAPFVLFRVIVYFGISAAFILATGTGAGIGWGVGAFGDGDFQVSSTFYGGLFGFAATAGVLFFVRDYILYIVKAGHIAVMVEIMQGGAVPGGRGQIEHATAVVKARFGEASALFALDRLIKGVVGVVTGLIQGILNFLPIPGVDQLMGVVRAYLKVSVGLVDEVILAHGIKTKAENPWASAQDGLVLYAQNARPLMINAAWLTLFSYALSFVVFLVMLAPAALVVYLLPGSWSAGGFVFAILFAWAVKAALIEPFAIACLLQVFFKVTEGQQPDPVWRAKLDGATDKFKELGRRASGWVGARFSGSAS
ncbi:hypothetical protein GCM10010873_28780 [Cypionkella aquatica]|uniref:Uncharacterized protein n=1 Tax=Cypionkella aquatica TaxID=1756042 RepID=A0AA37X2B6_9RHOB|nr:hypothetical protein [Cypionkella aquatica]GLS87904.1 hypothetical protein GCM10010873_28780 [Cypionkella aquatica]